MFTKAFQFRFNGEPYAAQQSPCAGLRFALASAVLFALIAAVALYILRHRHLPQLVERAALKAKSSRLSLLLLSLLGRAKTE